MNRSSAFFLHCFWLEEPAVHLGRTSKVQSVRPGYSTLHADALRLRAEAFRRGARGVQARRAGDVASRWNVVEWEAVG